MHDQKCKQDDKKQKRKSFFCVRSSPSAMNDPSKYEDSKSHIHLALAELWPPLLAAMDWDPERYPNPRILDYGCGPGSTCLNFFVPYAEKYDGHIVGVDSSPEMVIFAKQKAAHPRAEFHVGNIQETSTVFGFGGVLAGDSFDKIMCSLVFHFLKPHKEALSRLVQLLKPSGQLAFLNISKAPHFDFLQKLAVDPRFGVHMRAAGFERYIPSWVEEGVNFEDDLRAHLDGGRPELKVITMRTHKLEFDVRPATLAEFLYSVGPLSGRLPSKEVEVELKEWYRQQLVQNLQVNGDFVRYNDEITVGLLEKEV